MPKSRNWTDALDIEQLSRQLAHLRHDIAGMSRSATRYGSHTAHDVGDQLWHQGEVVARQLGKQAKKAGKAVKEDPVPAIVAIAGFALFLNLVLGRKRG